MSGPCEVCYWFRAEEDSGQCLVNPPVAFVIPMQGPQGVQPQVISAFPIVRRQDRCSKFQRDVGVATQ